MENASMTLARLFSRLSVSALSLLFVLLCPQRLCAQPAGVQSFHYGTEFLGAFHLPENQSFFTAGSSEGVLFQVLADSDSEVSIEFPVGSPLVGSPFSVAAGSTLTIPLATTNSDLGVLRFEGPFSISATEPVAVTISTEQEGLHPSAPEVGVSGTLLPPLSELGQEYMLIHHANSFFGSRFMVMGVEDNTSVTISVPARYGTRFNGVSTTLFENTTTPFTFNRGEVMTGLLALGSANNPGGAVIAADKPILVSTSSVNALAGYDFFGTFACVRERVLSGEIVSAIEQPISDWGTTFLVAPFIERDLLVTRVIASQDGTEIRFNGALQSTINRGEVFDLDCVAGGGILEATAPVSVAQFFYGKGSSAGGLPLGDPAKTHLRDLSTLFQQSTFASLGFTIFMDTVGYVQVIARDEDVGSISLDGTPINAAEFTRLGLPTSGYQYANIQVFSGTHQVDSILPHSVLYYQFGSEEAALFNPSGFTFDRFATVDSTPPVTVISDSGDPCVQTFLGQEMQASEDTNGNGVLDGGEDLNNNRMIDFDSGVQSVRLEAGSANATLSVDTFTPGDTSVSGELAIIDQTQEARGTIVVVDVEGNEASFPFNFSCVASTPSPQPTATVTPESCETISLSESSGNIDGTADAMRQLLLRQLGLTRRSAKSGRCSPVPPAKRRRLKQQIVQRYQDLWALAWTSLPQETFVCTDSSVVPEGCVSNNITTLKEEVLSLSREMVTIGQKIRRHCDDARPKWVKKFARKMREEREVMQSLIENYPSTVISCE